MLLCIPGHWQGLHFNGGDQCALVWLGPLALEFYILRQSPKNEVAGHTNCKDDGKEKSSQPKAKVENPYQEQIRK